MTRTRNSILLPSLILLLPIFVWGSIALYWMPIGVHWHWVSFGFLFAFLVILLFMMSREKEEEATQTQIVEKEVSNLQTHELQEVKNQLLEKVALLEEVEKKSSLIERSKAEIEERFYREISACEAKIQELKDGSQQKEKSLLEKESCCRELESACLRLQEKIDELKLELDTVIATKSSSEEKELFFFFVEEEASQFLQKKQKEGEPLLKHSLSSLQRWVENEKEGFLLLISQKEHQILSSNLPLFSLFTSDKEEWPRLSEEENSIQKIERGETVFLFKKMESSPAGSPLFIGTAYHALSD